MALTADQIQARIDSIQAALDSGVLIVRHGDESSQFRSYDDMRKIIAALQGQLDTLNGTAKPRVRYLQQTTKGFGGCE